MASWAVEDPAIEGCTAAMMHLIFANLSECKTSARLGTKQNEKEWKTTQDSRTTAEGTNVGPHWRLGVTVSRVCSSWSIMPI